MLSSLTGSNKLEREGMAGTSLESTHNITKSKSWDSYVSDGTGNPES